MLPFAIALTHAWAGLYTRGLPADRRTQRREEIDCDLWEHQRLADLQREPVTATAAAILLRLLLGIPADIVWRLETGASARSGRVTQMNDTLAMRGLLTVALAIAAFPLVIGILVAVGLNGEMDNAERAIYGPLQIVIGSSIFGGLVLSLRRPALGIGLMVAGTIAISAMWYWAAMITIPIGVGLIALAYFRSRRPGWPRGARPA